MKASETALRVLLEGQKQFIIPLFQRPYSWDKAKWETLWIDILETYQASADAQHFLGSIVSKSLPGTPEGVAPYLVIDGQQRLATLTVLLAALRDANRAEHPDLAEKIDSLYLKNRFVSQLNAYKVLPTQADRASYFAILEGRPTDGQSSGIDRAYRFFRLKLTSNSPDDPSVEPRKLEQTILGGLSLVSITLGPEDNEYRIFESLNAKGMPLKQADLLRNYFFMRIPVSQQDETYVNLWRPMEIALGAHLEDFFRYEYMTRGEFVREADVYQEWKRQLDQVPADQLVERLKDLGEHVRYYERIVNPEREPEPAISAAFRRLNRWGAQTIYPFLLFAYGEYSAGAVDGSGFANLLGIVESFLVRRLFAGVPTNALNRLFLRLGEQLPEGMNLLEGTVAVLSQPSRRWPKDEEFRQGVLHYPLYTDSRPDQRRLILETLERSHRHKEAPELVGLTVEHVMPQVITQEWRQELGSEAEKVHAKLLHVLGNLTLTGYNPELSNGPWANKRRLLVESNLEMNKEIAKEDVWGEAQILQRGSDLAEQALKLWSGPVTDGINGGAQTEEVLIPAHWANFYQACIDRLEPFLKVKLLRETTTVLTSDDGTCAVVCLVSREYDGRSYWWTFRSRHQEALAGASKSFLSLGCGSADQLLTIPFTDWQPHLDGLSSVTRGSLVNWHIHVHREGDRFKLHRKGNLPDVDLTRYLLRP